MQSGFLAKFAYTVLLLSVSISIPKADAQAVTPGQRLDKQPLYLDAQGGLSNATSLTDVLPRQNFTLSQAEPGNQTNCYSPGATDECSNLSSQWTVYNATYSDRPNDPVYVCICAGAPFDAHSLASNYSHVSDDGRIQ